MIHPVCSWLSRQFRGYALAMTSPDSIGPAVDTALSHELEDLINRYPQCTFGRDKATGVWVAIEWPSETSVGMTWGHTLAELAAKLDAGP